MVSLLQPTAVLRPEQMRSEFLRCASSPSYFVNNYCQILDPVTKAWIPFRLWGFQEEVLLAFHLYQLVVVLKARQLGLSWLALAYVLWGMLFDPIATVLLFSRREDESTALLGDSRLRGMYDHLPDWLKVESQDRDNVKYWGLSNESSARAFPTTAGDSYSATHVIVDEADLIPDLNKLMGRIKPTIDAGGKLFLISRVDKDAPGSEFKKIFQGAVAGVNGWHDIFLAWNARPDRDQAWYERIKADILERTGSEDDLKEQYPASPEEALDPRTLSKRLPPEHVNRCYVKDVQPLHEDDLPAELVSIPDLTVWKLPERYGSYVAGADTAEGLPNSDDSVTILLNRETGEQCAKIAGKIPATLHAIYSSKLMRFYNNAQIMPENNNHGYTFIQWFVDNGQEGRVLTGHNKKLGWTSSTLGKVLMYDLAAEMLREEETIIYDPITVGQLKSIEKNTLRAPAGDGSYDDHADAFALALEAIVESRKQSVPATFRQGRVIR